MTTHEIACVRALERASAYWAHREFINRMIVTSDLVPSPPLAEQEAAWLNALVIRYRRQVADKALVATCEASVPGAQLRLEVGA